MSEQGLLVFFKCPKCKSDHRHLRCINCDKEREFTLTDNAALCSCMIPTEQVECPQCKAIVVQKFFFQHGSLEEEKAAQAQHAKNTLMGCGMLLVLAIVALWFFGAFDEKPKPKKKLHKIARRVSVRSVAHPPKPKYEDLSNTLAGQMLVYEKHKIFISTNVREMGRICQSRNRRKWNRWSKHASVHIKAMSELAKKQSKRIHSTIMIHIESTYPKVAAVWLACNRYMQGKSPNIRSVAASLAKKMRYIHAEYAQLRKRAEAEPLPRTCKSVESDVKFLDLMYVVATGRGYKPTVENCSKMVDRLKGHFSKKWLGRHGPIFPKHGEHPLHTVRRTLRDKAVKTTLEFACVGEKRMRRKYGRQEVRRRKKQYQDILQAIRDYCKFKK